MELLGIWLILALYSSIKVWPDLLARMFSSPDSATRLVQVRELLAGQSWWDLTLYRIGIAGAEMHWSRHVDGLLGGTNVLLRPVFGVDAAELAALVLVPLGLLAVTLWLVSSIARILWPREDVGLYAMVVAGLAVGVLQRFEPGAIDHHGLQIVLVLTVVRAVIGPASRAAGLVAGVAMGLSLTVGLETLPILAAILAGLGIEWAVGGTRSRVMYGALGISLASSAVISSLLFGPPNRLFSHECDVLSLGFFGLVALPALGLAAFAGREWRTIRRLWSLVGIAAASSVWFGSFSPQCVAGPYEALPETANQVWLSRIAEVQGFLSFAGDRRLAAFAMALGPIVGLSYLGWFVWRTKRTEWVPALMALSTTIGMTVWQVRTVPLVSALAAPALGVLVVRVRDSIQWSLGRPFVALVVAVALSGIVPWNLAGIRGSDSDVPSAAVGPCVDEELLDDLQELEQGLVAVEVDLGPDVLVHTNHRTLASPYHRAYEGVLRVYDLFVSYPEAAAEIARDQGISFVMVCDDSAWSRNWSADNEDGLLALLLNDDPPGWLEKVAENGRSRIYAVRSLGHD
jgi:hypothetical protein